MKKTILLFLSICFTIVIYAQAPTAFQYQAVIRNDDGSLMKEQAVSVRIKIHEATANGNVIFTETHQVTTSVSGAISLQIGKGTAVHAQLSEINWAGNTCFIETEIDKGAGYVSIGTLQLLSVPYAIHAQTAENVQLKSANEKKWNIVIDNDGNISTQEVTE